MGAEQLPPTFLKSVGTLGSWPQRAHSLTIRNWESRDLGSLRVGSVTSVWLLNWIWEIWGRWVGSHTIDGFQNKDKGGACRCYPIT